MNRNKTNQLFCRAKGFCINKTIPLLNQQNCWTIPNVNATLIYILQHDKKLFHYKHLLLQTNDAVNKNMRHKSLTKF